MVNEHFSQKEQFRKKRLKMLLHLGEDRPNLLHLPNSCAEAELGRDSRAPHIMDEHVQEYLALLKLLLSRSHFLLAYRH